MDEASGGGAEPPAGSDTPLQTLAQVYDELGHPEGYH